MRGVTVRSDVARGKRLGVRGFAEILIFILLANMVVYLYTSVLVPLHLKSRKVHSPYSTTKHT
jgi:hypothetical protein